MSRISVITVVLNDVGNIAKTLASVRDQVYQDIELIVIDGGSRDGTIQAMEPFRPVIAHWISERDRGIYDAMNKGLSLATGTYVVFLNSGDAFYDQYTLSAITNMLEKQPDLVLGSTLLVFNDGTSIAVNIKYTDMGKLYKGFLPANHQSIIFRKALFDDVGGFDPNYKLAGDYEWFVRMDRLRKRKLAVAVSKRPLARYLAGGASETRRVAFYKEASRIVKDRYDYAKYLRHCLLEGTKAFLIELLQTMHLHVMVRRILLRLKNRMLPQ